MLPATASPDNVATPASNSYNDETGCIVLHTFRKSVATSPHEMQRRAHERIKPLQLETRCSRKLGLERVRALSGHSRTLHKKRSHWCEPPEERGLVQPETITQRFSGERCVVGMVTKKTERRRRMASGVSCEKAKKKKREQKRRSHTDEATRLSTKKHHGTLRGLRHAHHDRA